jgi:hypothetical protein
VEYFVLLGLLLFKHGVLAHVIDWGYSEARNPHNRCWRMYLTRQVIVEALVSGGLYRWLHPMPGHLLSLMLASELVALIVSCLVERRAPMRKLIEYHLLSELAVLLVYAMLAFIVSPFT